ncbi:short-chain dehydrogenase [Mycobacterium saskatchewanense]|uniref:Short-chain dehydrogenase n=1 Tax=Mycobacterium saskatchewanense TaxID=220927 RepID=A0AAJ3TW00_9MYCO|nr:SDR family oxidoreductase [Mycobacterium saskatchewanense]ORW72930.1 hypothetical protein AWC23_08735 [Mycobacterium saskatchewanense]BBX62540.1 short-chain dehydrogenase [Mycobacterium saskatchewanense]
MTDQTRSRVLAGHSVVITGAGRGLGAAFARLAAAEGARLVVNDINAAAARQIAVELGEVTEAIADSSDVSSWHGAERLIGTCIARYGSIDGLVSNAGVIAVGRPEEATEADLRHVIEVNLLGTAFCGVHALRAMLLQGRGSIVNVTSGAQLGLPTVAAYAASKGGITSLTYSWAAATKGSGVRVNAVSPDAATPLAAEVAQHFPDTPAGDKSPESNAPAVVYLLSDLASSVTGQVVLTGGERLSVLDPPSPRRPAARQPEWTVELVAQAFRERWS